MNHRPNLLLVTHRVPYPPDKGDRIRTFHLLKFLSRRASVHLAALADEPTSAEAVRALATYCQRVAIAPLGAGRWLRGGGSLLRGSSISEGVFQSSELARTLENWSAETPFHATIASASSVAPYLRVGRLASVPAVVDLVDVDSQKWHDYANSSQFPKSMLYRFEGSRLRQSERRIAGWAKAITVVSDAEARLLRQVAPAAPVHAVTNGVDLDYFTRETETHDARNCVFVGALDYRPNVDAACWFAQNIWRAVVQEHPMARLLLVGRNPAAAVRRLTSVSGVEVIGTVPDVRPHVRGSAVVIAPLRIARGLQNKVLEAMALGKAVVASPQALAGFRDDVPAVPAVTVSEWVAAISRLLQDPDERCRLGTAGRAFAEEHHDWERCLEPLLSLVGLGEDSLTSMSDRGRDRILAG